MFLPKSDNCSVTSMLAVDDEVVWCGLCDGSISILASSTAKQVHSIQAGAPVFCMALVECNKERLVLCSLVDGKILAYSLNFSLQFSDSKRFSPSCFVTCVLQKGAHLWMGTSKGDVIISSSECAPFEKLGSFDSIHVSFVSSLVAYDNLVWSGSYDRRIIVWNADGDSITKRTELNGHGSRVNGMVLTDKHVWSFASDKNLCIWDKKDLRIVKEVISAHSDSVLCGVQCGDRVYTGAASLCKNIRGWIVGDASSEEGKKKEQQSVENLLTLADMTLGLFSPTVESKNQENKVF